VNTASSATFVDFDVLENSQLRRERRLPADRAEFLRIQLEVFANQALASGGRAAACLRLEARRNLDSHVDSHVHDLS
jgi:hypothetical protein